MIQLSNDIHIIYLTHEDMNAALKTKITEW